jgi:hypothetical protein
MWDNQASPDDLPKIYQKYMMHGWPINWDLL